MLNKDEKLSFRLSSDLKEKILNHANEKEVSISSKDENKINLINTLILKDCIYE